MITFKPIIALSGRRKDGTWPVRIRVTFKGVVRRVSTTLVCTEADITRGGKIKNGTILNKAAELIARMREACADLSPFTLEAWTVDDVVQHIRERLSADTFRLDFFEFADRYLDGRTGAQIAPSTRASYTTALNTLERYLGERRLDVNDITRKMVLDFQEWDEAQPFMHWNPDGTYKPGNRVKRPGGASARHTDKLAHIFGKAKFQYNDEDAGRILIPRSPFDGLVKAYPPSLRKTALPVETIQRLIDAQPQDWKEAVGRAAFLLSFCTMGANLADLYSQKKAPDGVWIYNRRKTAPRREDRAEVRVLLTGPAKSFVGDLMGQGGPPGWWLPALHRWGNLTTATAICNRGLASWAEREGIERFTFGAARHSWGTIARRIGIEKATVDEALAHVGDYRITDIYAERNWALSWEANAKVLALFTWPD